MFVLSVAKYLSCYLACRVVPKILARFSSKEPLSELFLFSGASSSPFLDLGVCFLILILEPKSVRPLQAFDHESERGNFQMLWIVLKIGIHLLDIVVRLIRTLTSFHFDFEQRLDARNSQLIQFESDSLFHCQMKSAQQRSFS